MHTVFQCERQSPSARVSNGQVSEAAGAADASVMTAWALSLRDKAEVLAQFLLEFHRWSRYKGELLEGVQDTRSRLMSVKESISTALARKLARNVALNIQQAASAPDDPEKKREAESAVQDFYRFRELPRSLHSQERSAVDELEQVLAEFSDTPRTEDSTRAHQFSIPKDSDRLKDVAARTRLDPRQWQENLEDLSRAVGSLSESWKTQNARQQKLDEKVQVTRRFAQYGSDQ
jgi:hypothetical protein